MEAGLLAVTAVAETFAAAQRASLAAAEAIQFEGKQFRKDIGWRERRRLGSSATFPAMPELPEVETIVRDLRPELLGRRFLGARLSHEDVLRGVTRRTLVAGLKGRRVRTVSRRAKHAVIRDRRAPPGGPARHDRLAAGAGRPLTAEERRYAVAPHRARRRAHPGVPDVRRLGTLLWLDPKELGGVRCRHRSRTARAGLHTPAVLRRILSGSRAAVEEKVLMDQRAVAGVGNIYANEALFAARVDPSKPACLVSAPAARQLHRHIVRILQAAIASQGTTFRDYRTGTGESGQFQLELEVYGREGQALPPLRDHAGRHPRHRRAHHRLLPPLPDMTAPAMALPLPDTNFDGLRRRVRTIAEQRPGIYRMLDASGRVLYVGKAKLLRSRLLTYFNAKYPEDKGPGSSTPPVT
jgi:formamidopyrimidine-DNA glycosylase